MRKKALAAAALLAALAAAALFLRGPAGGGDAQHSQATQAPAPGLRGKDGVGGARATAGTAPAIATPSDPLLTRDLALRLESLLLAAGAADSPALLKQRAAALVSRHFPADQVVRATQLLDRYVDYRVALGDLKPPGRSDDPRRLRDTLLARQRVRERFFAAEEYDALFAEQDELDRLSLARLEILRNPDLSEAQKQTALRDAERELGDAQRSARSEAAQHIAVAAQTAAFDASGASEQERHAQRAAQYGETAATQLAQLDREQHDWHARLDAYAAARAANASAAELAALRQRLFSPQEQLRLDAALQWRAQSRNIPAR